MFIQGVFHHRGVLLLDIQGFTMYWKCAYSSVFMGNRRPRSSSTSNSNFKKKTNKQILGFITARAPSWDIIKEILAKMFIVRSPTGLRVSPRPRQTSCNSQTRRFCSTRPTHRSCRIVQTRAMGESFDINLYYEASIQE